MNRNVLLRCAHNSARSIFGKTIVNAMRDRGLCAYRTGSNPVAAAHPEALALLASLSIPTDTPSEAAHA